MCSFAIKIVWFGFSVTTEEMVMPGNFTGLKEKSVNRCCKTSDGLYGKSSPGIRCDEAVRWYWNYCSS